MARLAVLRLRDFMLPTLDPAIAQLRLLPDILGRADPVLAEHLSQVNPYFALSSTLTLYAHDIEDYEEIARLFDFLLAHEAVVSLYLFAVVSLCIGLRSYNWSLYSADHHCSSIRTA